MISFKRLANTCQHPGCFEPSAFTEIKASRGMLEVYYWCGDHAIERQDTQPELEAV